MSKSIHHAPRDPAHQEPVHPAPAHPTPVPLPGHLDRFLRDPRLGGRGNGPLRTAALQRLQQTVGNRAAGQVLARRRDAALPPRPIQRGDPHMALGPQASANLINQPRTVHKQDPETEKVKDTGQAFVLQGLNNTVIETLKQWRQARGASKDSLYVLGQIVQTGTKDLERVTVLDAVKPDDRLGALTEEVGNPGKAPPDLHYLGLNDHKGNLQSFASFSINQGRDTEASSLVVHQLGSNPAQKVKYAGMELMRQLALLSRGLGHEGRITLQAFKDAVGFYNRLGFVEVAQEGAEVFEAVEHEWANNPPPPQMPIPEDVSTEGRVQRLRERMNRAIREAKLEIPPQEVEEEIQDERGLIEGMEYAQWTDQQAWENTSVYHRTPKEFR